MDLYYTITELSKLLIEQEGWKKPLVEFETYLFGESYAGNYDMKMITV